MHDIFFLSAVSTVTNDISTESECVNNDKDFCDLLRNILKKTISPIPTPTSNSSTTITTTPLTKVSTVRASYLLTPAGRQLTTLEFKKLLEEVLNKTVFNRTTTTAAPIDRTLVRIGYYRSYFGKDWIL